MEGGFQVGDVVQLRQGNTPMTVEAVTDAGVWCIWFPMKETDREGPDRVTPTKVRYSATLHRATLRPDEIERCA